MSTYYRIDASMFTKFAVARLSAKDFRVAFMQALNGELSPLSEFVKGPYTRPLAHEWKEIREGIFQRDDYTCTYCGERGGKLECDHILPVRLGGDHSEGNLTTSCKACNRAKAGKHPDDWKGSL